MQRPARTLFWPALFAIAMALVEAAAVVHLRTIYYPGDARALFPLVLMSHRDLGLEPAREAATVSARRLPLGPVERRCAADCG